MYRAANRKIASLALATLLALPLLTLASRPVGAQTIDTASGAQLDGTLSRQYYRYDFNENVEPWTSGAFYNPRWDRPELFDVLGLGGGKKESYAALTNNGADLLWMQADFKADASLLHLRFDIANVEGAERLAPIVFVGRTAPTSVIGVQKIGDPLEKGPQTQFMLIDLGELGLENSKFVLAIGFMNLDDVQGKQVASIDNVVVVIDDGE